MNSLHRILFAAVALAGAFLFAPATQAAMVPTMRLIDTAAQGSIIDVRQHRGGRYYRGGGRGQYYGRHRGFRGGSGYAPRRYWGRPVYRGYSNCVRRGWVFNGYRYVMRRYRVC